jgi:hypothetical protein
MSPRMCGHKMDMAGKPRGTEARDDQQTRLIERLRAAHGAPVDFEELRAIGIEHPAVLSYELEVAGLPIRQARDATRRTLALDQPQEPTPVGRDRVSEQSAAPSSSHAGRAGAVSTLRAGRSRGQALAAAAGAIVEWLRPPLSRLGSRTMDLFSRAAGIRAVIGQLDRRRRAIASARTARAVLLAGVLALSIAATAALAAALINLAGSPRAGVRADSTGGRAAGRESSGGARGGPRAASTPRHDSGPAPQASGGIQAPAAPVRVSPAAAAALEAEGHQLLAAGDYPAAVEHLLVAVRASGQSLERCMEPTTETCLTFAYALYDLGRALRLKGDPGAAIPVLSKRLRIDNQRPVVEHELALARGSGA